MKIQSVQHYFKNTSRNFMIATIALFGMSACSNTISRDVASNYAKDVLTLGEYATASVSNPIDSFKTTGNSAQINYWAEILNAKIEDIGFKQGQKMIQDSLFGIKSQHLVKEFPIFVNINNDGNELTQKLKKEVRKFFSAKEMYELSKRAPITANSDKSIDQETFYWQILNLYGTHRKAFYNGAKTERNKNK